MYWIVYPIFQGPLTYSSKNLPQIYKIYRNLLVKVWLTFTNKTIKFYQNR